MNDIENNKPPKDAAVPPTAIPTIAKILENIAIWKIYRSIMER